MSAGPEQKHANGTSLILKLTAQTSTGPASVIRKYLREPLPHRGQHKTALSTKLGSLWAS